MTEKEFKTIDLFGNLKLNFSFNKDCKIDELKGIIFIGIPKNLLDLYNADKQHKFKAILQGYRKCGDSVHLIKGESICPQVNNGVIYAAGIHILLKKLGDKGKVEYYSVLIKDKQKGDVYRSM